MKRLAIILFLFSSTSYADNEMHYLVTTSSCYSDADKATFAREFRGSPSTDCTKVCIKKTVKKKAVEKTDKRTNENCFIKPHSKAHQMANILNSFFKILKHPTDLADLEEVVNANAGNLDDMVRKMFRKKRKQTCSRYRSEIQDLIKHSATLSCPGTVVAEPFTPSDATKAKTKKIE